MDRLHYIGAHHGDEYVDYLRFEQDQVYLMAQARAGNFVEHRKAGLHQAECARLDTELKASGKAQCP